MGAFSNIFYEFRMFIFYNIEIWFRDDGASELWFRFFWGEKDHLIEICLNFRLLTHFLVFPLFSFSSSESISLFNKMIVAKSSASTILNCQWMNTQSLKVDVGWNRANAALQKFSISFFIQHSIQHRVRNVWKECWMHLSRPYVIKI